jgi:hypothetical protein
MPKLYRVTYVTAEPHEQLSEWFGRKSDALREAGKSDLIQVFRVPTQKGLLIAFLNRYATEKSLSQVMEYGW